MQTPLLNTSPPRALAGESVADPLRYFKNVTVNTINLLEAMHQTGVNKVC